LYQLHFPQFRPVNATGTYIIIDLKGENNQAYGALYKKYFVTVSRFITTNNVTSHDAEDIFQDT
jgi:DNA-directed RNA polymerase specialized sigma24 family protein